MCMPKRIDMPNFEAPVDKTSLHLRTIGSRCLLPLDEYCDESKFYTKALLSPHYFGHELAQILTNMFSLPFGITKVFA
jgi:hypothetical protein